MMRVVSLFLLRLRVILARPLLSVPGMTPHPEDRHHAETADIEVQRPDLIAIRGILLPTAWDPRGRVAAVSLWGYHEDEYLIDGGEDRAALVGFMRREVEVVGVVRDSEGKKVITVKSVQTCPGPREPEEDKTAARIV